MDFNPTSGRTADRASWEGALQCLREVLEACQQVRPGFSISTDTAWDQLSKISQTPAVEAPVQSALRQAIPSCRLVHVVTDADDFGAVNEAIRLGGRIRIAFANRQPLGGEPSRDLAIYLSAVLGAQQILRPTLLEGQRLWPSGLRLQGTVESSVFQHPQTRLKSAVLVNAGTQTEQIQLETALDGSAKPAEPLLVWQPATGVTRCVPPTQLTIPGEQLAILTEQAVGEQLASLDKWESSTGHRRQRVVVDFRTPGDLQGWTLQGDAFDVTAVPSLFRKPTLNSLGKAGESAIGVTTSPPIELAAEFDHMEFIFHGAAGEATSRGPNLALRILDADSRQVLQQITPPGTHVLTRQMFPLGDLRGKTVRLQLLDENTGVSYAWLGLRRVTLITAAP